MPQVIDIPGVGQVEFPDGMSDQDIVKAIRTKIAPQKAAPLEDPGLGQTMLIGAGRTFDRIGKGMQQMYYGATGNEAELQKLKARAAEDDRLYRPLQEARPFSTGIGESLPAMAIPGGGAPTLLGNALRMGVAGALPGMLEYGSAGERAQRGVIGGVSGAAMPLLGAAAKTGHSFIEPLYAKGRDAIAGRTLNRVAGESMDDIIARLKGATELVPGSKPTAAEVAQSGGIAALQRSASAANPEAYTQRAMDQASARMSALRGIAGDDAALAAAREARDAAAESLYGRAFQTDAMRRSLVADQAKAAAAMNGVGANVAVDDLATPGLRELMKRPMFKKAADAAAELAANKGVDLGDPTKSLQGLHFIKLALDDMADPKAATALGRNAASAVNDMRAKLTEELATVAPLYGNARKTFQQMSGPINQMELGRDLLDRVAPALSDYGALGKETGATFARALRNADDTAARVTGFKGANMADIFSPDQMSTVENVARDLARKTNAQELGRGVGSDTFQKLSMQNISEASGMPRLAGGLLQLPGVSRATSWIYRDTDQQMQGLLADALLDPKKAAGLMEMADKKWLKDNPKTRRLLEQTVLRGAGLLGLAGTNEIAYATE